MNCAIVESITLKFKVFLLSKLNICKYNEQIRSFEPLLLEPEIKIVDT